MANEPLPAEEQFPCRFCGGSGLAWCAATTDDKSTAQACPICLRARITLLEQQASLYEDQLGQYEAQLKSAQQDAGRLNRGLDRAIELIQPENCRAVLDLLVALRHPAITGEARE